MQARELLDTGQLGPALEQLTAEIKAQPTDAQKRTFFFELLCLAGDWTRAEKQLDVLAHQAGGPTAQLGQHHLKALLDAEKARERLFQQGVRPRFMLEPPPEVAFHLDALAALLNHQDDDARAALDRAAEVRCPVAGTIGDIVFDDLRDADDLLAPVLEVFAPAGYCWVPWEQIQFLEVFAPKTLRDLIWAPARLASFDGQMGEVFLPTRYPGSTADADDLVRLGRKTDWRDGPAGMTRGLGAKLIVVGEDARTIPELGTVQFRAQATN